MTDEQVKYFIQISREDAIIRWLTDQEVILLHYDDSESCDVPFSDVLAHTEEYAIHKTEDQMGKELNSTTVLPTGYSVVSIFEKGMRENLTQARQILIEKSSFVSLSEAVKYIDDALAELDKF
jgi:hypothetical protein